MKKIICLILVVLTMCSLLAACSSFTCDICGEKKSGNKNTENILGEEIVYCDDCKNQLEQLGDLF